MTKIIKPSMPNYKRHVLVCVGDKCTENGEGLALYNTLKEKLITSELNKGELRVIRSKTTCLGICKSGPLVCVQPDGIWYYHITPNKLDRIIDEHLIAGKTVLEWVCHSQPHTCIENQ